MAHDQTIIVEWTVPEFTYREKSVDWFWALGIIIVVGIVLAIFSKNFLLGLLVILAGGLLFFFARKKPDMMSVEISEQGVRVNNAFYPYHNIESFWLGNNTHGEPIMFLHVKRMFTPLMIVPVHPEIQFVQLRDVLLNFVTEQEHEEPIGHKISDRLGF